MNVISEGGVSLGALAALTSSFTWALGATAYAALSERYAPYRVHFGRAIVALPSFALVFLLFESKKFGGAGAALEAMHAGNYLWLAGSILATYALGDIFFLLSLNRIGISGALALASTYPVWSALTGWFFQGEPLRPFQVAGLGSVVIGVVGVILLGRRDRVRSLKRVSTRGDDSHYTDSHYTTGVVLGLLTGVFWALNTFTLARGAHPDLPALSNAVRMLVAIVLCPLFGWFVFRSPLGSPLMSRKDFRKYGFILWIEAFGGSLCFVYGMSHAKLAVASALSSLAPVIAYTLACLLGRERLTWARAVSVLLVVAGTWLLL